LRFIDLFAGVGGFRLGMERAGHECVWSCEIDKWCRAVYRYHWGEVDAGDAREVDPRDIPDFDCLCAGFPCQSFSIAGKRRGFRDPRGTLFFEICRIARAKRPRLLLLENVRGLLSVDRGETFATVLQELGRLGYGVEWQVLNSKDYGVPQNRERVFIVGHLGGFRGRQVFPITEGREVDAGVAGEAEEGGEGAGNQVASALDANYHKGRRAGRMLIHASFPGGAREYRDESPTISTPSGGRHLPFVAQPFPIRFLNRNQRNFDPDVAMMADTAQSTGVAIYRHPMNYGRRSVYLPDEVHPSLRTVSRPPRALDATNPRPKDEGCRYHLADEARSLKGPSGNQRTLVVGNIYPSGGEAGRVIDSRGVYPTVKQGKRGGKAGMPPIAEGKLALFDGHPDGKPRNALRSGRTPELGILPNMRIRRLTPRECERLQGFPDDWTRWGIDEDGKKIEISDTQRYRMMGNAVTVNVVEFLGRRLREVGYG